MALVKTPGGLINPLPGKIPPFANYVDPEGVWERPGYRGVRRHGGTDWFATFGTALVAPEAGVIVEADADFGCRTANCQVFGGTTKLRTNDGRVWVFRHTSPTARVGQRVGPGQAIAKVSKWPTNPRGSHAHIELWKTLAGGYVQTNIVDPSMFLRTGRATPPPSNPASPPGKAPTVKPGTQSRVPGQGTDPFAGREPQVNVGGAARDVWNAATAIPNAFKWIFENWDRVLEVAGGAMLLLIGLWQLSKNADLPRPGFARG